MTKQLRVIQVIGWLIDGLGANHANDNRVLKKIKLEYNIGVRQARTYLKEAREKIVNDQSEALTLKRTKRILQLENEIQELKSKYQGTPQGLNSRVRAYKEIIRLEGITPPKQHEISIGEVIPIITKRLPNV